MKKLLLILLAAFLVFSMVACGESNNGNNFENSENNGNDNTYEPNDISQSQDVSQDEGDDEYPSEGDNYSQEASDETNNSENDSGVSTEIVLKYAYRADKAGYFDISWYSSRGDWDAITDIYGNEIYRFPEDGDEELVVYANGFFISKINDVYYLKNVKGEEIFSTESLGVSGFGFIDGYQEEEFLADGYVLVYKINEAYNGTTYEIGILKTDGTWAAPLSADNPIITCGIKLEAKTFKKELRYAGEGCIILPLTEYDNPYWKDEYRFDNCLYNINTNKILRYLDPPCSDYGFDYKISQIKFNSDGICYSPSGSTMYEFHTDGTFKKYAYIPEDVPVFETYGRYIAPDGKIYAMINDGWGVVLTSNEAKIKDYQDDDNVDIDNIDYIGNGKWLVDIKTNEGSHYYSIVDITGNFLFDPVKTDAGYVVYTNGASVKANTAAKVIVIKESGSIVYETD